LAAAPSAATLKRGTNTHGELAGQSGSVGIFFLLQDFLSKHSLTKLPNWQPYQWKNYEYRSGEQANCYVAHSSPAILLTLEIAASRKAMRTYFRAR